MLHEESTNVLCLKPGGILDGCCLVSRFYVERLYLAPIGILEFCSATIVVAWCDFSYLLVSHHASITIHATGVMSQRTPLDGQGTMRDVSEFSFRGFGGPRGRSVRPSRRTSLRTTTGMVKGEVCASAIASRYTTKFDAQVTNKPA